MRHRFDGIQLFVEVAEAGNFAKAGERMAMSRSAVGKAIARLEERLGVQLFHRTTRSQSLTEDGQQYYERCVRAIEEIFAGETMLENGRREVVGKLRVSLPVLFGRYCIAPVLVNFARQHPGLELELSFSDRQVDLIAEGFDLAVRNGFPGNTSTLRAKLLMQQRKILCASPDYLALHGQPDSLSDLKNHALLPYWQGGYCFPWRLPGHNGQLTDLTVTSRLRFDDLEVIADAATAGMGLAWLPYWLIGERIHGGRLTEIWSDRPGATMDCYAVWPATQYQPLRSRMAIDILTTELADLPDTLLLSLHTVVSAK